MQTNVRSRTSTDRLGLADEPQSDSLSYFQWQERTVRTTAFKVEPKLQPKQSRIVRLFRRFA
ncbi:hypothetical protein [Steroidobacter sp.]|uniref:hypothetical protein n=1 Tax=Steroidobacter sp. TaxID=1978227 RepID=UPI0025F71CDE|nr:hypothetical protein [Steroidobacter sp.]